MKNYLIALVFIGFLASCGEESELSVVYPKEYFPAYPGSWWFYSNGERTSVLPDYVAHSYQSSINSNEYTDEKLVPCINGQYLYEYKITQHSTRFPVKQLLSESTGVPWVVDTVNGEAIKRQTIGKLDSIFVFIPSVSADADSAKYYNVLVVVEFTDSMTYAKWNLKEYYAKDVGLICTEVNNPYDTLGAIVQKTLIHYFINN
ncbi:MAG: hypothetical protein A2W97_14605 [Bacteroidetes bacterium GWE2_40_63]|jgi:hypothetical protein|nr:MAG: hypothetical protein A2W95_16040 [Bacteroidetes bacterium GWA2_40_14]OFX59971.1 MAG: hypothetical protein A2W84_14620 [Bacteroidetes bacterium GWC2_40_13]OFX70917.1 MAG: hypothetical protein A2W96_13935 [Bacteroidetes bacterium GWD2_40_43]OFX91184.1 MAG: hypothetical protein A2W97_14605 [Bacteroidetes bacterium GWE2_40_63]OFY22860.1 MAG: hypothetical protein A2W88_08700 [Bacteroidetes bacterium GWF2_40_13]OFZ25892.1 MAG: hypothetical protein A2437_16940 [Bacteroidetes bacterium RIFOXYC